jgi:hypothetical protein
MKCKLLLIAVGLFFGSLSFSQDIYCLYGNWIGTVEADGYSYEAAELAIDIDSSYQENTNEYMNFSAYPESGQIIAYDLEAGWITFEWLYLVYSGDETYSSSTMTILTFTEDSLIFEDATGSRLFSYGRHPDNPVPHPDCSFPDTGTASISTDANITSKELVRVVDLLGRIVEDPGKRLGEILIYQYSDGTTEKKVVTP